MLAVSGSRNKSTRDLSGNATAVCDESRVGRQATPGDPSTGSHQNKSGGSLAPREFGSVREHHADRRATIADIHRADAPQDRHQEFLSDASNIPPPHAGDGQAEGENRAIAHSPNPRLPYSLLSTLYFPAQLGPARMRYENLS